MNIFNFCAGIVGLYYTILLLAINQPYLALYDVPLIIYATIAFLLNYYGKHNYSTYFTFIILPLILLAISSVYGRVACEYFLVPFIIVLAYLNKPLKVLFLFLVYYLIIFIASKHFETAVNPDSPADTLAVYFYYTNITFAFFNVFVFMRLFILQYESHRQVLDSKNIEIEKKYAELENKNNKIQILLKEISHRTKNNLQLISSLISIQSNEVDDPKNKAILEDIKARIFSIALVHKKLHLSKKNNKIMLGEYLEELANTIINSLSKDDVKLKISSDDISMQIDDIVHLGIMLNELLSNSIQHGLADVQNKSISIRIKRIEESKVLLAIYDSGRGIEKLKSPENHKFGFLLVLAMIEQFSGEIKVYEKNGNYIEITVILPKICTTC